MSGRVGVCTFGLRCKVDVLTLNPLYEICTVWEEIKAIQKEILLSSKCVRVRLCVCFICSQTVNDRIC